MMIKLKLQYSLFLFLIFIATSITIATPENQSHNDMGVLLHNTKVYKFPNIRSRVISIIRENTYVKIIGQTNKLVTFGKFTDMWYKVSISEQTGFIFAAFLFNLSELKYNRWKYYVYKSIDTPRFKNKIHSTLMFSRRGFAQILREANYRRPINSNKRVRPPVGYDFYGDFKISGRTISFKYFNPRIEREYKLIRLYLYRYAGKNYLTRLKYNIGSIKFRKPVDTEINVLFG